MDMESGCASLHAGLIQRARPPRGRPVRTPASPAAPRLDLSAFLVDRPAVAPPAVTPKAVVASPRPAAVPTGPRHALTVRVEPALYAALTAERSRSKGTNQSILRAALSEYLSRLRP